MRTIIILCLFIISNVCFASTYNTATSSSAKGTSASANKHKSNDEIIRQFARNNELYFFYSSHCPYCQEFAPIVKKFAERYNFRVVAITENRSFLPEFPNSLINTTQAERFGVDNGVPRLYVLIAKTRRPVLVADGYVEEDELRQNVLDVAKKHQN